MRSYLPAEVDVDGLAYREAMNAVDIRGGIAGNVIPDTCVVTVNYRFAPSRDEDEAEKLVRELFDGYEVTIVDSAPGAMPGLTNPAAAAFIAAVGAEPRPNTAGPTWHDSPRWASRPSTTGPATRTSPTPTTNGSTSPKSTGASGACGGGSPEHTIRVVASLTTVSPRSSERPSERHRGPVTLRRSQVEVSTTDQRLLESRGGADWVHTDPWRVMRIQSEFIEGFGSLAGLGAAISVFGSARTPADDPLYQTAVRLGSAWWAPDTA